MKYYLVGEIVNTFGIGGELKVKSDTSFDRFSVGNTLFVYLGGKYTEAKITSSRRHQGFELIRINGLNNINDVLMYKGCKIYTHHEVRLEEGHYYYEELIGLDVIVDGKMIGKVKDIRELPRGILLEVLVDGKIKLVPYEAEFIGEVTSTSITVYPIEGLL